MNSKNTTGSSIKPRKNNQNTGHIGKIEAHHPRRTKRTKTASKIIPSHIRKSPYIESKRMVTQTKRTIRIRTGHLAQNQTLDDQEARSPPNFVGRANY